MTRLTIGMPVYNGAEFIERALKSLHVQSFEDYTLYVSDNASTDETVKIVKKAAESDQRIRLVEQDYNVGAAANFVSLLSFAESPFFMWASADDWWSENYIEVCLEGLMNRPICGFASGGFKSVSRDGAVLRRIPSFNIPVGTSTIDRLVRYSFLAEASGKGNIIHSVFRTEIIKDVCSAGSQTLGEWGGDMAVVAAALSRSSYMQDERAFLSKQVNSEDDIKTSVILEKNGYREIQFGGSFPPNIVFQYIGTMTRCLKNGRYGYVVSTVLLFRSCFAFWWQARHKFGNLRRKMARNWKFLS